MIQESLHSGLPTASEILLVGEATCGGRGDVVFDYLPPPLPVWTNVAIESRLGNFQPLANLPGGHIRVAHEGLRQGNLLVGERPGPASGAPPRPSRPQPGHGPFAGQLTLKLR